MVGNTWGDRRDVWFIEDKQRKQRSDIVKLEGSVVIEGVLHPTSPAWAQVHGERITGLVFRDHQHLRHNRPSGSTLSRSCWRSWLSSSSWRGGSWLSSSSWGRGSWLSSASWGGGSWLSSYSWGGRSWLSSALTGAGARPISGSTLLIQILIETIETLGCGAVEVKPPYAGEDLLVKDSSWEISYEEVKLIFCLCFTIWT